MRPTAGQAGLHTGAIPGQRRHARLPGARALVEWLERPGTNYDDERDSTLDFGRIAMVTVSIAHQDADLEQILALQRRYLREALPIEAQNQQGFVYTQHDLPLLRRMAAELPQAVAADHGQIVGYCLSLPVSLRREQPMLEPMFVQFERCRYAGRPLASYPFFVGGQVCVDRPYRGRALLGRLYHEVRRSLRTPYALCVTEIAARNRTSIRAHAKVGFQQVSTYSDANEEWVVVVWNLADRSALHTPST